VRTIVFHSYKGGVGRSMALANLAIALSNRNYKVVVLDLDVDAPSMHLKFENEGLLNLDHGRLAGGYIDYLKQYYEPFEDMSEQRMILDDMLAATTKERVESLKRFVIDIAGNRFLKLIPAGDSSKNMYWSNLISDWLHNLLSLSREQITMAQKGRPIYLDNVRQILDEELKVVGEVFRGGTDYLLVDCRSSREYASVALCYWANTMVSMFNASAEAIHGAVQTQQFVLRARRSKEPEIVPVICRVPESFGATGSEEKLAHDEFIEHWRRGDPKGELRRPEKFSILHEYRDLEIAERLLLLSGKPQDKEVLLTHDYVELFVRILRGEAGAIKIPKVDVKSWKAAFGMTQDARVLESYFLRLSSGELVNKDLKRNVALRTDTLRSLMDSVIDLQKETLKQLKIKKINPWILNSFREAGYLIGCDFGQELMEEGRVWKVIPREMDRRLGDWCTFDRECGFGKLTHYYNLRKHIGTITWENNFLAEDTGKLKGKLRPHVREFSSGYVRGVLRQIFSDKCRDIKLAAKSQTRYDFKELGPIDTSAN
jgi:cellulose biosynthesis protein BcsQ